MVVQDQGVFSEEIHASHDQGHTAVPTGRHVETVLVLVDVMRRQGAPRTGP